MTTISNRPHLIPRLCLAVAVLSLSSAAAATRGVSGEIQARYERERAVCLSGQSNQDRATCLKEAGAAREEARRGQLDNGDNHLRSNAKARCAALTGDVPWPAKPAWRARAPSAAASRAVGCCARS